MIQYSAEIHEVEPNSHPPCIKLIATDPAYDFQVEAAKLIAGDFDRNNPLQSTMFLMKDHINPMVDTRISILSPIPPGASLGTSASASVSIAKSLCNGCVSDEEAAQIAWRAKLAII